MKIAVIFTGGTIGSKVKNNIISTSDDVKYQLLNACPKGVEADIFEPYTTLSEHLNGEHLNLLFKCIKILDVKNYDGIIITHGTDTIQFSAAALSFAFARFKIPIMLVGAQKVLDHPDSNGFINFTDSIEFIKSKLFNGTFVCYQNSDGKRLVHKGARLLAAEPYSDDLKSVCNSHLGEFTSKGFVLNETNFDKAIDKITLPDVTFKKYCEHVFCIEARLGIFNDFIAPKTKAILHSTFHCGTLNTKNESIFNLAKSKNIPVYLTGSGESVSYESAVDFSKLKLLALPKMSPLAAYIKLWMITDNNLSQEIMFKNICGELL